MKNFKIDDINKTVNFTFDYDEGLKNEIKALDLNTRFNKEFNEWIVPITPYTKNNIFNIIKKYNFTQSKIVVSDVKYDYKKSDVDYAYLKGLCDSKNFGYDPYKYQLECLAYQLEKGSLINGDDVGTGKCEYVENRVFTPYGRCRIGDIKVGDFVIGSDGNKTKVKEVHVQPNKKKLYRVTFNDGFSSLFTKEHLFNVTSSNGGYNSKNRKTRIHTLSIEQMLNKDLFLKKEGLGKNIKKKYSFKTYYKNKNGSNKWQIPITKPVNYRSSESLPIDPYLLGFMLGDGYINNSGTVKLEFHKDDFEEVLCGYEYDEKKPNNNCRVAYIKYFKNEIKSLGLNGKTSYHKFIPDIYKYSSIEDRLSILRGLMDSDGYVSKSKNFEECSFSTSSKVMLDDLVEIVHSLGGIARLRKPKYKSYTYKGKSLVSKNLSYGCSIKLQGEDLPFKLKRKSSRITLPTKYPVGRYIKDISFEKYGDSVCISVDAKDSLYLTDHAIVTHNTAESIFYTEVTNKLPCLVICPSSVKYNWGDKWKEVANNNKRTISIIETGQNNDWNADIVVINYDIIGKKAGTGATLNFKELLEVDWKMIVCDEAHYLKNKKSQRAIATKKIIDNCDATIQLLTGTAIKSKPIQIWNLLNLIDKHKLIADDWKHFITRYCGGYRGKFGWVTDGATNMIELNEKLRNNCYIRREKREVRKDLPEVIKQVIQVPISNLSKINKAKSNFINYIKETKGEEAADKAMEAEHLVAINEMRNLSIQGKLKAIEDYIKTWIDSYDKKLLIMGVHKQPLEYLSKKFKSPLISGGVSSRDKQSIVNDWQTNSNKLLFANGDSAGTGTDGLQKCCSNMIVIELPWETSDLEQWVGRIDRTGQDETPNINFLLSFDTIDKEMWEMLESKERVAHAVNKGVDIKKSKSSIKNIVKKFLKS